MHAALLQSNDPNSNASPALRVYDDSAEDRVGEIVELLRDDHLPGMTLYGQMQVEFDRERRRLRHAVELVRTARSKLHEQFQRHELEQQRLLIAIREEWKTRRHRLERELAAAALAKARAEVADERAQQRHEAQREVAQIVAEQQQIRDTLLAEQNRFEAERDRQTAEQQALTESVRRDASEWDARKAEADQQLHELQRKLVEAELTIVQDRSEWTAERREWNDQRQVAQGIIEELLAEVEATKANEDQQQQHADMHPQL